MRRRIVHPYEDRERRIVKRFLFWPRTLSVPKKERLLTSTEERRWLESAWIEQFYSHWNRCWINSTWAEESK